MTLFDVAMAACYYLLPLAFTYVSATTIITWEFCSDKWLFYDLKPARLFATTTTVRTTGQNVCFMYIPVPLPGN